MRCLPTILVTGTPGTGKTTICAKLQSLNPAFKHVDVANIIKKKKLYREWDDSMKASIYDSKKVRKYLKRMLSRRSKGGLIIDFHGVNVVPSKAVDLVIVMMADTNVLYDRLLRRDYSMEKIQENVQCEIFGTILEEVLEKFEQKKIKKVKCNTELDQAKILKKLCTYIMYYVSRNQRDATE